MIKQKKESFTNRLKKTIVLNQQKAKVILIIKLNKIQKKLLMIHKNLI